VRDLVNSFIFILCHLALLGLVLSPLLLGRPGQASRTGKIRSLYYGVPAAILLVTAIINIVKAEFPGDRRITLSTQVLAGKEVVIRFDPETCALFELGSIACGSDYHGRYDRGRNRWTIAGLDRNTGAATTGVATNGESSVGVLSLWGVLFHFEDDGTIVHLGQGIGHLRIETNTRYPKSP
jgi:hypothetical protein